MRKTVSYKMEKDWTAKRKYHEKSGRRVRNDKVHTDEDKKELAKARTAAWRLENPRAR